MGWIMGGVKSRRIGQESASDSLVDSVELDRSFEVVYWALLVDLRRNDALRERILAHRVRGR
jgi:hypothetical protein